MKKLIATWTSLTLLAAAVPAQTVELQRGDTICLIGNALAERMQHHGWLEARLQARLPELELSFRNLGFSGDELDTRRRTAGFGSPDEWLARCGADVIFAFFGFVESFGGAEGLDGFRAELEDFVDETLAQTYGDDGPPRLVLFSSIPFEDLADPDLPDGAEHNARIELYNGVMAEVAADRGVPFVDLYAPMQRPFRPQTINGIHLTDYGNDVLARVIEAALFPGEPDGPDGQRTADVRELVLEKNHLWFNRYRATDGYNVYGGRSNLRYTPGGFTTGSGRYAEGVSNYEILQRELHVLDGLCAGLDRRIHAAARGDDPDGVAGPKLPPLIPVETNKPGPHTYLGGEEAIARMTIAEGMEIGLFASEEQFPELVNPVQMAWDTRGRLWVAVWPTYPHWEPGKPMNDKLIILEDTDGDGRADVSKTFAGDLHNPTGFEFWNGGVIVANCPDLLFLKDTDGDDVYDTTERLLHGLSSADTHHAANSFVLGPDGALYFQEGTFHMSQVENVHNGVQRNSGGCVWRFEPRTHRVERFIPYGFANPHGHVFDRWGQNFMTDGTGNVNYYALPFSGHIEFPDNHRGYFPFFQQRSRPCGGTEILSSGHFPEANQGNYLVANVIGFQGIFQYEIEDAGSGFGADEVDPIVHSTDPNFRPVDIEVGPDGAIYFVDWHNVIIGHMQHHLRDPSRDAEHGRVYRVTWKGRPLLDPVPIAGRPIDELLELLKSPEDRVRYRARIELSGRNSDEVVALARSWARGMEESGEAGVHHLLEALWVQQQHGALDVDLLDELLAHDDARARAAATRVLRHMRHHLDDPLERLRERVVDAHPRVRLEAVVALSHLDTPAATTAALMAKTRDTDRFLDYALGETLRAHEANWVQAAREIGADNPTGRDHLLALLSTEDLKTVPGGAAEMLQRHGLDADDYGRAAAEVGQAEGRPAVEVLLDAIRAADAQTHGHADHLLMGLFAALRATDPPTDALGALAREGRRASTRKLATAAHLQRAPVEATWAEAARSPETLAELLDAAPLVDDAAVKRALFPHVIQVARTETANEPRTRGRFVRVELPGEQRTLTLAEVEVLTGEGNVAPRGTATQSTLNWGGVPERAMDGNKSGKWLENGQTHTLENQPNPWWELDLGEEHAIHEVVLWNRTDAQWGRRLDGFVLRVLDEGRRTVFEHRAGEAQPRNAVVMAPPSVRVRRAAIRAIAALGVHDDEAFLALVHGFADPDLRDAAMEGMRAVPFEDWPEQPFLELAGAMLMTLSSGQLGDFESPLGREVLALADELAPLVDPFDDVGGRVMRELRARLGPQVYVIRPVRDALLYDRTEITVIAGHPVEIVFDNTDLMPHNLLISTPGSLAEVGMAAEAMAQDPDAWDRAFVPELPSVLHATGLLQPGSSETLKFDAPADTGSYPFVCTFPGHWVRMNGVMRVVTEWDEIVYAEEVEVAEATAPARPFVRNWTEEDLKPHLRRIASASAERGRTVLDEATCLRCHAVDGEGGVTGPDLREVLERHQDAGALLAQIVDPSAQVLEGYESEIFLTTDGLVVSGRVVRQEGDVLLVQDDPYRDDYLELPLDEIDERTRSTVSLMPAGLLSTFERDEILDLLAYLESLR